jgi:hypothetical protein
MIYRRRNRLRNRRASLGEDHSPTMFPRPRDGSPNDADGHQSKYGDAA